ncbi:hypothetical protein CPT_Mendera_140 [Stenotrophomonas phage Mendera]|uniref:Uncharacterized protein n=1 Tax=Stenotrophomonas phage Mendera TaxID=2650877 RepID=A0A5P8PKX5_9CAUD|nr:hypothetical protein HWC60_gp261 [Stenotrophomonas phage Mendera]QFR56680.1 hypothetical protein CPT_Mendera_140 [Stenotrophomonas phage Mendera]
MPSSSKNTWWCGVPGPENQVVEGDLNRHP